nr:protein kinase [Chitinispirillaceae bacterium]
MPDKKPPADSEKGTISLRSMLTNLERTFLPLESTIGKYQIISEIDRGGMAVVYKATQLDLDRTVALKVMPANLSINRPFLERFLKEAHAVAQLSHPNIVSIYEVAVENNIYFLAMEYVPGKNLFYHLTFSKPKLVDVLLIVSRIAEALECAHAHKIIHRDLKLNNIIMKDMHTPVLIDFGLAKALDDESDHSITRSGEIIGSPSYMAPERLQGGPVDHRSDICSLGIMLYEMLTFKNPYLDQRNLHQTAQNVMAANPISPRKLVPWLPPEIEAITLKAMAKDPEQRYQSMAEFREDINRYQRSEPVLAQQPSRWSRLRYGTRRYWPQISITAIIAAFSLVVGFMHFQRKASEQSRWQHCFEETFSLGAMPANWQFFPADSIANWKLTDKTLAGKADGPSCARLEQRFDRDIRVEADVSTTDTNLFNAGIFLFGDTPESGYGFHLNRSSDNSTGMTLPGSSFLIRNDDPDRVILHKSNHVLIERINGEITFTVNGIVAAGVQDLLPPRGSSHERLGFFVNGSSASFDNLAISRRAVPTAPKPTLAADRFLERGEFEAALSEYRTLKLDLRESAQTTEIDRMIAECLMRLGRYDEARAALKQARNKQDDSRNLFLESVILDRQGSPAAADSVRRVLSIRHAGSPASNAAMMMVASRIAEKISGNDPGPAGPLIIAFAAWYQREPGLAFRLRIMLARRYAETGNLDSAIAIVEHLILSQPRNSELLIAAKTELGMLCLDNGWKSRAGDLFTQSIAGPLNSSACRAWLGLAGIYAYNFQRDEAASIYQNIFSNAPVHLPARWIAGLRLGELAFRDSATDFSAYFRQVRDGSHPFPLPRLIARFYLGELSEEEFTKEWKKLCPNDHTY